MIQFDNIKGNHQIQAYKKKDNRKNSKCEYRSTCTVL